MLGQRENGRGTGRIRGRRNCGQHWRFAFKRKYFLINFMFIFLPKCMYVQHFCVGSYGEYQILSNLSYRRL